MECALNKYTLLLFYLFIFLGWKAHGPMVLGPYLLDVSLDLWYVEQVSVDLLGRDLFRGYQLEE